MDKCQYAKKCSGCQLQNLTYNEQLHMKQAKLIALLSKFGHVNEIIGMKDPLHYRNKVQSAFGVKDGKIISGVYQSATGRIVQADHCMLEDLKAQEIVASVRRLCYLFKIKPYDLRQGRGYLRHVLVRCGFNSGEIMVVLVTAEGQFPAKKAFVAKLLELHPEITTVVHSVNTTQTALFLGARSEVLYGEGYISDSLCGLNFRISPKSFYQVNPVQTEILYSTAVKYAALTGKEKLIDAYCGTGTIGLIMAKGAGQVMGVEVNAEAVKDAKANAARNGIKNVRFYCADAGDYMETLASESQHIDTVVTDPPRAGCSRRFLESLVSLFPDKVVYISCNPETLARDLSFLCRKGYKAIKIQPVDMFPFTEHVESVVCLTRHNELPLA